MVPRGLVSCLTSTTHYTQENANRFNVQRFVPGNKREIPRQVELKELEDGNSRQYHTRRGITPA